MDQNQNNIELLEKRKEELRNSLNELSVAGGGSFVNAINRATLAPNTKILCVGLGGMGGKTINALKKVYIEKFAQTTNVRFLAVDADGDSLAEVEMPKGYLNSTDETFQLWSEDARHLLTNRPPVVREFLSENVPAQELLPDGLQQRRCNGRVVLAGTGKYRAMKTYLNTIFDDFNLQNHEILEIVLIAGISGGTGAGTFIDVAYMLREICREHGGDNSHCYGFFYTPSVQRNVPEIKASPSTWQNLQRNGYASLKELDYFMNVGNARQDARSVYTINTVSGSFGSHLPIFNPGNAYIITARDQSNDPQECQKIIENTANAILCMFQPSAAQNGGGQSILSTLANTGIPDTWRNNHVGIGGDPTGNRNCDFPVFMNYAYRSFGYRSVYFPRNELVAYVANQAMADLFKQWERAFQWQQGQIDNFLENNLKLSYDAVYDSVMTAANFNSDKLKLQGESAPVASFGNLDKDSVDNAVSEAQSLPNRYLNGISREFSGAADRIAERAIETLDGIVANQYGPFGLLVLLSGIYNDNRITPVLKKLQTMMGRELAEEVQRLGAVLSDKKVAMDDHAAKRRKDLLDSPAEISAFVTSCQEYSEAAFKKLFYERYMGTVLQVVYNKLNDYNSKVFDTYVPLVQALKEILEKDSQSFVTDSLTNHGSTRVFTMNAFRLNVAKANIDRINQMLEGCINTQQLAVLKNDFNDAFFAPATRRNWEQLTQPGNEPALAAEIRKVFNSITGGFVGQTLEQIMVLLFADTEKLKTLLGGKAPRVSDLNGIWNNNQLRQAALSSAGKAIADVLLESRMTEFALPPSIEGNIDDRHIELQLPPETLNLNVAVKQAVTSLTNIPANNIGGGNTADNRTEIRMVYSVAPFALAQVADMRAYAKEYYESEATPVVSAGRHLNEVALANGGEEWQTYLPEIYGLDAVDYFTEHLNEPYAGIYDGLNPVGGKTVSNDEELYGKLKVAVSYAEAKGYLRILQTPDGDRYQLVLTGVLSESVMNSIRKKIMDNRPVKPDYTWFDALTEIHEDPTNPYRYSIRPVSYENNNIVLQAKQTNEPAGTHERRNIERIFRANMELCRLIIRLMEEYEANGFFERIDEMVKEADALQVYDEALKLFIIAKKCGMLYYQDQGYRFCLDRNGSRTDRDIMLLEDFKAKNDLDEAFTWVRVFTAFAKMLGIEENSFVPDYITTTYEDHRRHGTGFEPCRLFLDETEKAFTLDAYREIIPARKSETVMTLYNGSNYGAYYAYPKAVSSFADLDSNLTRFRDTLRKLSIGWGDFKD